MPSNDLCTVAERNSINALHREAVSTALWYGPNHELAIAAWRRLMDAIDVVINRLDLESGRNIAE